MGSKGARYIVLPAYVVNISLLYALLLTIGLMLAWVTIHRHEESITELRRMLKNIQTDENKLLPTAKGPRGDRGKLHSDLNNGKKQVILREISCLIASQLCLGSCLS